MQDMFNKAVSFPFLMLTKLGKFIIAQVFIFTYLTFMVLK